MPFGLREGPSCPCFVVGDLAEHPTMLGSDALPDHEVPIARPRGLGTKAIFRCALATLHPSTDNGEAPLGLSTLPARAEDVATRNQGRYVQLGLQCTR